MTVEEGSSLGGFSAKPNAPSQHSRDPGGARSRGLGPRLPRSPAGATSSPGGASREERQESPLGQKRARRSRRAR